MKNDRTQAFIVGENVTRTPKISDLPAVVEEAEALAALIMAAGTNSEALDLANNDPIQVGGLMLLSRVEMMGAYIRSEMEKARQGDAHVAEA